MTSFGLDGRVAVVTGAARGIGEAIVRTLAKNGVSILLVDILADQVTKVADDLRREHPNAKFVPIGVDLTRQSEVNRLGDLYRESFAHAPDIVVNNAAICRVREWTEVPESEFDEIIAANLKAVHMVGQYFARLALEQQRKQSIINIASFTAYAGLTHMSIYVAAKAGVIGLMRVLAKELGPKGIRVNCVCPGYIRTPMNDYMTKEEFEEVRNQIPMRRIGQPQDIANMVLFLSSDLASFCHGSCYDVHGGHTL